LRETAFISDPFAKTSSWTNFGFDKTLGKPPERYGRPAYLLIDKTSAEADKIFRKMERLEFAGFHRYSGAGWRQRREDSDVDGY
jgi:hypothetical protein